MPSQTIPALVGLLVLTLLVLRLSDFTPQRRAYARSKRSKDELTQARDRLLLVLDESKLYRRMDLTLEHASMAAGVDPRLISQALSQMEGRSFPELLTERRVDEAKRLLRLPENARCAVEAIGMEAGFRSRSSFYKAFREATGLSPAAFRDKS